MTTIIASPLTTHWPTQPAYVNYVDCSADPLLLPYHPTATILNEETSFRQQLVLDDTNVEQFRIQVGAGQGLGGTAWSKPAHTIFEQAVFVPSQRFPNSYECQTLDLTATSTTIPSNYQTLTIVVTLVAVNARDPLDFRQKYNLFLSTLLWNVAPAAQRRDLSPVVTSYTWRNNH